MTILDQVMVFFLFLHCVVVKCSDISEECIFQNSNVLVTSRFQWLISAEG
jgi:hypothetical protein